MLLFCLGVGVMVIGDFGSVVGELFVFVELVEVCVYVVMKSGIDFVVFYCMQVDYGFVQLLEFLFGGLDKVLVLFVFINGVVMLLFGFQCICMLGEVIGCFISIFNKCVLFLGFGGFFYQLLVFELVKVDVYMCDCLLGSGKDLFVSECELCQ